MCKSVFFHALNIFITSHNNEFLQNQKRNQSNLPELYCYTMYFEKKKKWILLQNANEWMNG